MTIGSLSKRKDSITNIGLVRRNKSFDLHNQKMLNKTLTNQLFINFISIPTLKKNSHLSMITAKLKILFMDRFRYDL